MPSFLELGGVKIIIENQELGSLFGSSVIMYFDRKIMSIYESIRLKLTRAHS